MVKLEIVIGPEELVALGYCTAAGADLAKKRKEAGIYEAIMSLTTKILNAEKPQVKKYGQ